MFSLPELLFTKLLLIYFMFQPFQFQTLSQGPIYAHRMSCWRICKLPSVAAEAVPPKSPNMLASCFLLYEIHNIQHVLVLQDSFGIGKNVVSTYSSILIVMIPFGGATD